MLRYLMSEFTAETADPSKGPVGLWRAEVAKKNAFSGSWNGSAGLVVPDGARSLLQTRSTCGSVKG